MHSDPTTVIARLARNTTMIALSRVAMALTAIATMPILIGRLGIAAYGVWETLLAITAFGALWQGPLGGTLMWATSQAHARGEQEKLCQLFKVGMLVTAVLAIPLLTCVIALREFLPIVFHVPSHVRRDAAVILPAVAATTLATGINECYAAVIDGCQRMGVTAMVRAAAYICGSVVALFCVLWGEGLYSIVFGQWTAALTAWVLLRRIARSLCPSLKAGVSIPVRADGRRLGAYGGLLLVGYVAAAFRDQTDKLILAACASPLWVGYYAVAARLTAVVLELCRFVYGPTVSAAGVLSAHIDTPGLLALYTTVMKWLPAGLGAAVIFVGGFHAPLVLLWMGKQMPEVTVIVFLLLVGNVSAVVLTGPGTAICRGVGRIELETRYVVVTLAFNLFLTAVLVTMVGAIGTVWASAVSWLIGSVYFALSFPDQLHFPKVPALRAAATITISAIFAALLAWFAQASLITSRLDALLLIAWSAPLAVLLYASILFLCRLLDLPDSWSPLRRLAITRAAGV